MTRGGCGSAGDTATREKRQREDVELVTREVQRKGRRASQVPDGDEVDWEPEPGVGAQPLISAPRGLEKERLAGPP